MELKRKSKATCKKFLCLADVLICEIVNFLGNECCIQFVSKRFYNYITQKYKWKCFVYQRIGFKTQTCDYVSNFISYNTNLYKMDFDVIWLIKKGFKQEQVYSIKNLAHFFVCDETIFFQDDNSLIIYDRVSYKKKTIKNVYGRFLGKFKSMFLFYVDLEIIGASYEKGKFTTIWKRPRRFLSRWRCKAVENQGIVFVSEKNVLNFLMPENKLKWCLSFSNNILQVLTTKKSIFLLTAEEILFMNLDATYVNIIEKGDYDFSVNTIFFIENHLAFFVENIIEKIWFFPFLE